MSSDPMGNLCSLLTGISSWLWVGFGIFFTWRSRPRGLTDCFGPGSQFFLHWDRAWPEWILKRGRSEASSIDTTFAIYPGGIWVSYAGPHSNFLHQLQRALILQMLLSWYILIQTDEYNLKHFMGSDFFLIKVALCFTVTLKVLFIITFFRSPLGK